MFGSGLFFSGLVTVAFSQSDSIFLWSLLWFLNGFAQGAGWPACAKVLRHWFSPNQFGTWWSVSHVFLKQLFPTSLSSTGAFRFRKHFRRCFAFHRCLLHTALWMEVQCLDRWLRFHHPGTHFLLCCHQFTDRRRDGHFCKAAAQRLYFEYVNRSAAFVFV